MTPAVFRRQHVSDPTEKCNWLDIWFKLNERKLHTWHQKELQNKEVIIEEKLDSNERAEFVAPKAKRGMKMKAHILSKY